MIKTKEQVKMLLQQMLGCNFDGVVVVGFNHTNKGPNTRIAFAGVPVELLSHMSMILTIATQDQIKEMMSGGKVDGFVPFQ